MYYPYCQSDNVPSVELVGSGKTSYKFVKKSERYIKQMALSSTWLSTTEPISLSWELRANNHASLFDSSSIHQPSVPEILRPRLFSAMAVAQNSTICGLLTIREIDSATSPIWCLLHLPKQFHPMKKEYYLLHEMKHYLLKLSY